MLDFSRPGKPTDDSFIESFNGKFRAEYLNSHWFLRLDDARRKMEHWRRDYNEVRPHSDIGNKVPISLMDSSGASHPPRAYAPKILQSGYPNLEEVQGLRSATITSRLGPVMLRVCRRDWPDIVGKPEIYKELADDSLHQQNA